MSEQPTTFHRFDPADYLDDLDDVAAYLEMALEESAEDPTAVPRALLADEDIAILRAKIG